MAILGKKAILAAQDIPTEPVAVPEWGGEVLVRGLSGADRDAFEASVVEQKGKKTEYNLRNCEPASWRCAWSMRRANGCSRRRMCTFSARSRPGRCNGYGIRPGISPGCRKRTWRSWQKTPTAARAQILLPPSSGAGHDGR